MEERLDAGRYALAVSVARPLATVARTTPVNPECIALVTLVMGATLRVTLTLLAFLHTGNTAPDL